MHNVYISAKKSKCAPPVPVILHLHLRSLFPAVQLPGVHMSPAHSLPKFL